MAAQIQITPPKSSPASRATNDTPPARTRAVILPALTQEGSGVARFFLPRDVCAACDAAEGPLFDRAESPAQNRCLPYLAACSPLRRALQIFQHFLRVPFWLH